MSAGWQSESLRLWECSVAVWQCHSVTVWQWDSVTLQCESVRVSQCHSAVWQCRLFWFPRSIGGFISVLLFSHCGHHLRITISESDPSTAGEKDFWPGVGGDCREKQLGSSWHRTGDRVRWTKMWYQMTVWGKLKRRMKTIDFYQKNFRVIPWKCNFFRESCLLRFWSLLKVKRRWC